MFQFLAWRDNDAGIWKPMFPLFLGLKSEG